MKYCITLLTTLLIVSNIQAQSLRIGLEAGLGNAWTEANYVGVATRDEGTSTRIGARFGLPLEYHFSKLFQLNAGIFYAMKGNSSYPDNNMGGYLQTINLSYTSLDVPFCITYVKKSASRKNNFFIGLGPYISYGVAGKLRYYYYDGEKESQDVSWGNNDGKNQMKHWDWGAQMQVGIVFNNGFVCRFLVQKGFNNMSASTKQFFRIKDLEGAYLTIKNQAYTSLSIAYLLKHKNKH